MLFTTDDLATFWYAPWAAPLRSAIAAPTEPPLPRPDPLPRPPRWLRPLCVQRVVGKAVAARVAWQHAHRDEAPPYQFGKESEPEPYWTEIATFSYDPLCLRELSAKRLRWILGMEAERLLRIAQVAPAEVGVVTWTLAVLGVCEHVADLYAEFKRRHKAMPARNIVREEVQRVLGWRARAA
ncbi:MAG TPA: hypothetical protein VKT82_33940 [Ktedonobacterales bacterium]|nr:hypothetical protein [Ktedonobacterales bacterium]